MERTQNNETLRTGTINTNGIYEGYIRNTYHGNIGRRGILWTEKTGILRFTEYDASKDAEKLFNAYCTANN